MNRPLARMPLRVIATMSPAARFKWLLALAAAALVAVLAYLVSVEMQTSNMQARYLAKLDRGVSFSMASGASNNIRFPQHGPYDMQLGYAQLPGFQERLLARGYEVTQQARQSPTMTSLADQGLFVPYAEKDQAGLQLFDVDGQPFFSARFPSLAYADFDSIPPLVVSALTFIEDRYLLDSGEPNRNPAIDWGRFSRALTDQALRFVNRNQSTPGGSTLATQIEKFRHSPGGRTATPTEKLRQIASSSVRAYLGGQQTLPARRSIVVHYLNTVPLAAQPGVGEIEGLGDGLAAWYGRDFDEVNRLLSQASLRNRSDEATNETVTNEALAFKQVLSLLIAQRAPSHFLVRNPDTLERLTDSYLRVLANNGVISTSLRDAALAERLELHRAAPPLRATSYVARKAATLLRAQLAQMLGVKSVYALDRLDLTAHSTLNKNVQSAVSEQLARAGSVDGAKALGLYGRDMLESGDDPSKIAFSFTLFERRDGENVLRVQTDSVNQPFDINRGARLNLGSTAKLRTIVNYLQIVAELHARYAPLSNAELKRVQADPQDLLTRWAVDYLAHTNDRSLQTMLEAATQRKYSANPGELFATGGGLQAFTNFHKTDNGRILTVHDAFQHSVNLVFVRLMRDIVRHEMVAVAGPSAHWFDDPATRKQYLTRFADQESLVYLHRFYEKYEGKSPDAALDTLIAGMRSKTPVKVATALRSVAPEAPRPWFDGRMHSALQGTALARRLDDDDLGKLYAKYGPDKFNLNDRGYLARVHPVELWMLNYLRRHPNATESELRTTSKDARLTSYTWLFKTRHRDAQDIRIRRMVELEAYAEVTKSWRALGYPFQTVTPSYAAAVGASGDRPDALAQLIGIVANDGKMLPTHSIGSLLFAAGTPFETEFAHVSTNHAPVLSPEIARVVHDMLRDVVQGGTGGRLSAGLPLPDGRMLPVYGKTGTGDQRFQVYAPGARLIESRKVNRTGTFVFVLDDRFFGTLTAYVHEPYAARYSFTSALAVQMLKSLGPALAPLTGGAHMRTAATIPAQQRAAVSAREEREAAASTSF